MMPPSTQSLISIQKAGAAVFEADAELKIATKAYAERVAAAVALNAFNVGNDHLFENWKSLARAAQTMADIEAELRKVYSVVSELLAEEPQAINAVLALSAPSTLVASDLSIEAVTTQRKKRVSKVLPPVLVPSKKKAKAQKNHPSELKGNTAKLWPFLERALNDSQFIALNQSATAIQSGVPLGSMTSTIKKLIALGWLETDSAGHFRLEANR